MKLIRDPDLLAQERRRLCVAIGFFDGVHLGHQQIIRQTISDARQYEALALVVTFDQHPSVVLAPQRAPGLIYPLSKKLDVIEAMGADICLLVHFDKGFSQQPAEAFVRWLVGPERRVRSICVGANFAFGHKRGGNVQLLRELGAELGFGVHGLAAVALDGKAVSSTRIRQAVAAGQLYEASQMLGRGYTLAGKVVTGDKVGRQIGFPTANMDVAGLALPPGGVYAAHAKFNGSFHRAVVNIGSRPTLRDPTPVLRVEAHLLDFAGDLYGQQIEVAFVEKLREEKKFPSLAELREQIQRDISEAQSRF
ncbi:MAG TPA: bifunctional riboflavin kinase/FAD synthetase [Verrucomicrobiae bacterium]|nr:bifunctional riboflavin kinase/FAD synthetase [Verrucomicrobiae bacterium]